MPSTPSIRRTPRQAGGGRADPEPDHVGRSATSRPRAARPCMQVHKAHLSGQWWVQKQPPRVLWPILSWGLGGSTPLACPPLCVQTPDLQDYAIPLGRWPTPSLAPRAKQVCDQHLWDERAFPERLTNHTAHVHVLSLVSFPYISVSLKDKHCGNFMPPHFWRTEATTSRRHRTETRHPGRQAPGPEPLGSDPPTAKARPRAGPHPVPTSRAQ